MKLKKGTSISHYRIVSKIGKGGMGEVYLAEDTKLDRKVALKILPGEFAEDKDRMSRFVREAKSASALNHPNIITIYEINEIDGLHFISTEYIKGQTLDRYAKAKSLGSSSVLDIAIQVASALDEAHNAGIVHRDIKPDNVMIRENGLAKILDFGIAKATGGTGEAETREVGEEDKTLIAASPRPSVPASMMTAPGLIIGTPNYMSPEQARGKDVDHQTDIFSLGVVLYEMLSGNAPFAGETVSDVIAAVLTKEPKRLTGIPTELKAIVEKALQKDKKKRYETAKDLLDDLELAKLELEINSRFERASSPNLEEPKTHILKAATDGKSAGNITKDAANSIAVLPFTNISSDEDNEYFCDGLAEELSNALSKIEDLKVAARTSAFSFKDKNEGVSEIGEKLGVKTVLEGSVRKSGDKLRISVQLVNAADGYQIWSERYDREMKDIFDVQDEITLAVVDSLKLKLFDNEKIAREYEPKLPAYEAFLKGRFKYYKFSPEAFAEAEEYFKQAIEFDRGWAEPLSALGDLYFTLHFYGWRPQDEMIPFAEGSARTALELDPSQSMAHAVLGAIAALHDYDWEEAESQFQLANVSKSIEPNVHFYFAMFYLLPLGKFAEAKIEMDKASSSDPLNVMWHARKAWIYFCSGEYETAIAQANRALEIDEADYQSLMMIALSHYFQGKQSDARSFSERVFQIAPWDDLGSGLWAGILARDGENEKAKEVLANQIGSFTFGTMVFNLVRGDIDEAIDWYQKDLELRRPNAPMVANAEFCRPLREHPRWAILAKRMNLPDFEHHSISSKETDESLEASTVTRRPDIPKESAVAEPPTESKSNPEPRSQSSKLKWWLFGLLGLFVLAGGFFGYNYLSPTGDQINSIAVLPFENNGSDADTEYLSDGLAESLIFRLSQLPNLKVSPTSSVFRYKGKATDSSLIAKELGVDSVLTGRIVQRGDSLNISVELVDVRKNKLVWGEKYERKLSELLSTQRQIATEISQNLRLKLSGNEQGLTKPYTDSNEAYQLYLKGRYHFAKRTKSEMLKAIEYFQKAIELDPNFALAYARIAEVYNQMPAYPFISSKEMMPKSKAAARRALEIDPTLPEAYTAMGNYLSVYEWNWTEAERVFKRGIELAPNNADPHYRYGQVFLSPTGRHDEAIREVTRALELEPLDLTMSALLSQMLHVSGQDKKAIEQARKTLELEPNLALGTHVLSQALVTSGAYQEAIEVCEKTLSKSPNNQLILQIAGIAYAKSNRRDEAEKIIAKYREIAKSEYIQSYHLATIFVALGDHDKAFAELQESAEDRNWEFHQINVDPLMKPLHDDPRFAALVKKLNLPG